MRVSRLSARFVAVASIPRRQFSTFPRLLCSAPHFGGFSDETADMDEYEAMMFETMEPGATKDDSAGSPTATPSVPPTVPSSPVAAPRCIIDDVLLLLPQDGSAMAVTSLSALVDVEAIAASHGSLVAFLQAHASVVQLKRDERGRYFAQRAVSTLGSSSWASSGGPAAVLRPGAARLSSRLRDALRAPRETPASGLTSDATEVAAAVREVLQLVSSGERHVLEVRQCLTDAARSVVARVGSVAKFVRLHGIPQLEVSGDDRAIALAGSMAELRLARPAATAGSPSATATEGLPPPWEVDLGLGEDDDTDALVAAEIAARDAFRGDNDEQWAVDFEAQKKSEAARRAQRAAFAEDDSAIPDAPPQPAAAPLAAAELSTPIVPKHPIGARGSMAPRTPPPLRRADEGVTSSSGEIQRLHTAMALQRGWRTPQQMLDLFVAFVPTYFIDVSFLKVPEEARLVFGRVRPAKLLRVYGYFFDITTKDATMLVRLKESLQHPRRGAADALYSALVNPRLRRTADVNIPVTLRCDSPRSSPKNTTDRGSTWGVPQSAAGSPPPIAPAQGRTPHAALEVLVRAARFGEWMEPGEIAAAASVGATNAGVTLEGTSEDLTTSDGVQSIATRHAEWLRCRRRRGDGAVVLSLRPFWEAPTPHPAAAALFADDCDSRAARDDSVNVAAALEVAKAVVKPAGFWIPLARADARLRAANLTVNDLIDALLRRPSEYWVESSGERVRRFTGNPQLDDADHFSIPFLRQALEAFEPRAPIPIARVCECLPAGLQPMFAPERVVGGAAALARFFNAYPRYFVADSGATEGLRIARVSMFASRPSATSAGGSAGRGVAAATQPRG